VGKPGAWQKTIVGTVLGSQIYTVESSGALYETDPKTGVWKQIGKPEFGNTKFMFAVAGSLYTIETSGSLYQVSPQDGSWKGVGKPGAWQKTIAGTVLAPNIYTVESSGALYETDPKSGVWKQLGNPDFGNTVFMFPVSGMLYTIEKSGSLYEVQVK
jgi:hypothetical protein